MTCDDKDDFGPRYSICEAKQQRALLAFLHANGSVKAACTAVGVKYGTWYRWRRTSCEFEDAYQRALAALADEANLKREAARPEGVVMDAAVLAAILARPFSGAEVRVLLAILAKARRVGVGTPMYAPELAAAAGLRVSGAFRRAVADLELAGIIDVERSLIVGQRSVFTVRPVAEWGTPPRAVDGAPTAARSA